MTSDMDELFRKAAENYPLHTDHKAWEDLRSKLEKIAEQPNKGNNKKILLCGFLLLITLLPLVISEMQPTAKKTFIASMSISLKNNADQQKLKEADSEKNNTNISPSLDIKSSTAIGFHHPLLAVTVTDKTSDLDKKVNVIEKVNSSTTTENVETMDYTSAGIKIESKETVYKKIEKTPDTIPANSTLVNKDEKKLKKKKIYAGIIAGPDFSAVKMQSLHKVGFNVGIVTGIHLNKKISIESGLLVDKKYYSTSGEYFKTTKINLPAGVSIKTASGYCDMLEIPLNINYVLKQRARHALHLTAGFSSYIMKKEVYDLEVSRNGYAYPRNVTYNKPGSYAFAVMNLGIGFNKNIGKNIVLSISPVLKLPLREIGTGLLPVQSATVYIGYAHKLF